MEKEKVVPPILNRRNDKALRAAIDQIYSTLSDVKSEKEIVTTVTNALCELSSSSHVISYTLTLAKKGVPHLKWQHSAVSSKKSSSVITTNKDIVLEHTLNTLYKACVLNQTLVLQDKNIVDACFRNEKSNNPLVVIPVESETNTLVIFVLYGAKTSYHTEQVNRYSPLLSTMKHAFKILKNKEFTIEPFLESNTNYKKNFSLIETLSPSPLLILNKKGVIIRANPAFYTLFGYESYELVNQRITVIVPDAKYGASNHLNKNIEDSIQQKFKGLTKEKREISLLVTMVNIREESEDKILLLITEHSENTIVKNRYKMELARFQTLSELVPIGILQTDEKWHTCYVNSKWLEILDIESKEVDNLYWTHLFAPDEAEQILSELSDTLNNHQTFEYRGNIFTKFNKKLWIHFEAKPLFNVQGVLSGFIATIVDNTFHHNTQTKLRTIAETDHLTKLPNRLALTSRLEQSLERVERRGAMAMLSLDLDGFKNVNDTLGHDAGDQLLVQVANRISTILRENDFFARLGGDEFIILLEHIADSQIATAVAEKILVEINKPFKIGGKDVFISSSIGICFAVSGQKNTSSLLMKHADLAMYHAKAMGRNTIEYYTPTLDNNSKDRLELGNSLHRAISQKEFEVYYQLQVNLITKKVVGLEALMRWRKDGDTIITPDRFIPFLEESGLIIPVSRDVIKMALKQLAYWIKIGLLEQSTTVALNLSPKQFRDASLVKFILECLNECQLQGSNLVLEITETTLLQDSREVNDMLEQFSSQGIKIALDDFGTGYSSLCHLKNYPISEIKIDKSFTHDLLTDEYDHEITKAMIAMAKSLKLHIGAEGIETQAVYDELIALFCTTGQGYFLNKPQPADELANILNNYN